MPIRTWTFEFRTPASERPETVCPLQARVLPSVDKLQAFRRHLASEGVLCEYWFCPDHSRDDRYKPIYGWAGGRPAFTAAKENEGTTAEVFIPWSCLESASWEQLCGRVPLIKGLASALSTESRLVRVISLGEACLNSDTYEVDDPEQRPFVQTWERVLAAIIIDHPMVTVSAAPPKAWSATQCVRFRRPLEFLAQEPLVRRITHADGRLRCLIVGFAAHPEHMDGLPQFDAPGPLVHPVLVTDDDPAGLEMMELLLVQYRTLYKKHVEPFRGLPTFITPRPTYSFLTASQWRQLDLERLPSDVPRSVPQAKLDGANAEMLQDVGFTVAGQSSSPTAPQSSSRPAGSEDMSNLPQPPDHDFDSVVAVAAAIVVRACEALPVNHALALFRAFPDPAQFLALLGQDPKADDSLLERSGLTQRQWAELRKAWQVMGGLEKVTGAALTFLGQTRKSE